MQYMICVYDTVAERYYTPSFERSSREAVRSFEIAIGRAILAEDSLLSTNWCDFELRIVGEFDDIDGKITPYDFPVVLYRGKEYQITDRVMDAYMNKPVSEKEGVSNAPVSN